VADATKVTVIGGGAMGGAIIDGLLALPDVEVAVVESDEQRAQMWSARDGVEVATLDAAVRKADTVFLAVKPHHIVDTLQALAPNVNPGAVVVSIAAGITVETLQAHLPAGMAVIRAMPNTPMRVGRGVVGITPGSSCSSTQVDLVTTLMGSVAVVVPIAEDLMDALTATSGSGPAYVFYLAEAMKSGAQDLGIPEDIATTLVCEAIVGAAQLLATDPSNASGLRAAVTSKGGTTAAATAVFDTADLSGLVATAMRANRDRARELADEAR
jgi:pyrroline-5-carboxylate reductase